MRILWIIDFEYGPRFHHGAYLRFFNFAPQLIAQGHSVTFVVNFTDPDPRPSIEYLRDLKTQGVFTDFVEATYEVPLWRRRVSARLIYPGLMNMVLRGNQRRHADRVDAIARERGSDVIILTSRCYFLAQESRSGLPFVYDTVDSLTLYARRQLGALLKARNFVGFLRALEPSLLACAFEYYYARKPVMKVVVSPADKEAIDRVSGNSQMSTVILNGVKDGAPHHKHPKVPGRLVFTGNMDFPPNCEAAFWFLDRVFPLILEKRPDACFVIAGANPIPELLQRQSKNVRVTGFVDDMNAEIASSEIYVAPLVSGVGFKNKVAEAIVNRTPVIATSIAVDFLSWQMRDLVTVADSPEEMARAVIAGLADPLALELRVKALYEIVTAQFGWAGQASKLADVALKVVAQQLSRGAADAHARTRPW